VNVHAIAVNIQVHSNQSGKCRNPQPGTIAKRMQPTANNDRFYGWSGRFLKIGPAFRQPGFHG
jgi:hypothetical protein